MKEQKHKSLHLLREDESPKPLITKKELEEIAKKALREQVEKRIHELAVEQTTVERMAEDLAGMRETLDTYLKKLGANESLEREVLEKLKGKLDST